MAACQAAEGCVDELHAAMNAVAPPTDGSPELMAVVECLQSVTQAQRQEGPDSAALLRAAKTDCPEQLATCEGESGCMDELNAAMAGGAPPTEGPAPMLAVISCLREAAIARRQSRAGANPDGQQASPRPKFRPDKEMSDAEREAAQAEMVARVGDEVACALCTTLMVRPATLLLPG